MSNDQVHQGLETWQLHLKAMARLDSDFEMIRSRFPDIPICLAGDFNKNLDGRGRFGTPAVREALETMLRTHSLQCVTRDDFRALGQLQSRSTVDHICLSQPWDERITETRAWEAPVATNEKPISDHSGVSIEMSRDFP